MDGLARVERGMGLSGTQVDTHWNRHSVYNIEPKSLIYKCLKAKSLFLKDLEEIAR